MRRRCATSTRTIDFERGRDVEVTFEPGTTTVIELKLVAKGVPYWSRPDLGIDPGDVRVEGNRMTVKVHSLGAVDAPPSRVVLRDREGRVLATGDVPALKAPSDLMPKTAEAVLDAARQCRFARRHRNRGDERQRSRDHPAQQPGGTVTPAVFAAGGFVLYCAIAGIVLKAPVPLNFRPSTLIWPATGVLNSRVPRRCAVLDAYRDTRSKEV